MYSIDSSSILEAWTRRYPPDIFPVLWDNLASLIQEGRLLISEEILYELEKKSDEVFAWFKEYKDQLVVTDEEIQTLAEQVLSTHKKLIDTRTNRSGADPFVIAVAQAKGCAVITEEKPTGNDSRPKIPDVCNAYNLKFLSILDFIREQQWRF
jgi:hypothetical protein